MDVVCGGVGSRVRATRILPREFAFEPGRRRERARKSSEARASTQWAIHTRRAEARSSQASGSGRAWDASLRQTMPQPAALRQSCGAAEEMGC